LVSLPIFTIIIYIAVIIVVGYCYYCKYKNSFFNY